MRTVKYRCDKCGHSEEYTKKQLALLGIGKIFVSMVMALGVVTLAYIIYLGPDAYLSELTAASYLRMNNEQDNELRAIAYNMTRECYGDHPDCYVKGIYEGLKDTVYRPTSQNNDYYDPLYVLQYGGDCKNSANLAKALLNSVGMKARVVCSFNQRHCITTVYRDEQTYYVIDLTSPDIVLLEQGTDPWNYLTTPSVNW